MDEFMEQKKEINNKATELMKCLLDNDVENLERLSTELVKHCLMDDDFVGYDNNIFNHIGVVMAVYKNVNGEPDDDDDGFTLYYNRIDGKLAKVGFIKHCDDKSNPASPYLAYDPVSHRSFVISKRVLE